MSTTVLGGGISGLSAAYYLVKKFPLQRINLIEASSRTGGWIRTTIEQDVVFEQGPRTIRPSGLTGANTLELVEELDLVEEILPLTASDPAIKNRMVYVGGRLHKLPSDFLSLFKTRSPFSKPLYHSIIHDFKADKKVLLEDEDESIYNFVKRRFGEEIAEYAIAPLICGICAGDAHSISVKFLMEDMLKYEQKYGNVMTGLICNLFSRKPKLQHGKLNKCAKSDKWSIYTFRKGLETFVKRLEEVNRCNKVNIALNAPCEGIEFNDNKVNVHTARGMEKTDHLIACIPSNVVGNLIKGHPRLSLLLQKIPYVTVAVVNLQYNCNILEEQAFGFLVPPKENIPILGITFDSCCYPCGKGTVITVMMGGHWYNLHFGHNPSKEQLLETARYYVCHILGMPDYPDSYLVNIHTNCIPQYIIGHKKNVNEIHNYVKDRKLPLSLCGNSYYGVGINDAIWRSKIAVDELL